MVLSQIAKQSCRKSLLLFQSLAILVSFCLVSLMSRVVYISLAFGFASAVQYVLCQNRVHET